MRVISLVYILTTKIKYKYLLPAFGRNVVRSEKISKLVLQFRQYWRQVGSIQVHHVPRWLKLNFKGAEFKIFKERSFKIGLFNQFNCLNRWNYLLNWFALDKVGWGCWRLFAEGMLRRGLSNKFDIEEPRPPLPPPGRLGDSRVLWPRLGETWGEFWALPDHWCCNAWLKSIVTFRKKSHTDKFLPNNRADLYLNWIN